MKNKSLVVNVLCVVLILIGYACPPLLQHHVLNMGYFGLSGALTNWLAVHMLFERVPFLYGSGIIPLKFEAFKEAIREMIMNQFFTMENIKKFTEESEGFMPDLTPVIEHIDYNPIFDAFLEVIQKSKFGSMLGMFGGTKAIEPMREPFVIRLKEKLLELTTEPEFLTSLTHDARPDLHQVWQEKIQSMVDHRLEELTPQMVKEIIEKMIHSHLGWLVVWGGVFGCVIGLISSFLV